MNTLEKQLYLQQIDELWKDHLTTMDQLRTGLDYEDTDREIKKSTRKKASDSSIACSSTSNHGTGQLVRVQIETQKR